MIRRSKLIPNTYLTIWILSGTAIYLFSDSFNVGKLIVPLLFVWSFAFLLSRCRLRYVEYLLFFTISIASLLGLTETLTGSHAESTYVILFGLSFYTASMAYLISQNKFKYETVLAVSNPLLLVTGPIALYVKSISHRGLRKRIEYYVPFILIGTFMFQIVGTPLTEFFFLIQNTDVISSLAFAAIFELFVYVNFCGLSLLIYGVFGVFGYSIPLNFSQPFSSKNVVEYWRGWHRSLSQVLKVLFYNPIRKKFSIFFALLAVFMASAMWHGVTFNFILWGLFHAISFWLSIELLKQKKSLLPLVLLPFIIVVGRLIFADSDTNRLLEKLSFNFNGFSGIWEILTGPTHSLLALLFGFVIIVCEVVFKNTKVMRKRNYKFLRSPMALLTICLFGVLFASNVGVHYAVYGQR